MKKVVVMTTGGTIAMKYDPVTQGLIPAVSGDDLIEAVPALRHTIHDIADMELGFSGLLEHETRMGCRSVRIRIFLNGKAWNCRV